MKRRAADVTGGDGRAGRDKRLIGRQSADDFFGQKGFACSRGASEKDGLTPTDLLIARGGRGKTSDRQETAPLHVACNYCISREKRHTIPFLGRVVEWP